MIIGGAFARPVGQFYIKSDQTWFTLIFQLERRPALNKK